MSKGAWSAFGAAVMGVVAYTTFREKDTGGYIPLDGFVVLAVAPYVAGTSALAGYTVSCLGGSVIQSSCLVGAAVAGITAYSNTPE